MTPIFNTFLLEKKTKETMVLIRQINLIALLCSVLIALSSSFAATNDQAPGEQEQLDQYRKMRQPKYHWGYIDRDHTFKESLRHVGGLYLVTWGLYPLTQPKVFKEKGSWDNYQDNLGKLVFDKDEPIWNWVVHPISGSQLFLYYRANGYDRINSLAMAFVSSTLFEFTVEIYTEPASIQDLYQTPIIGSMLGVGLETLSMYLLNTGNVLGRVLGHAINPSTLFWFYEGKVQLVPTTDFKSAGALTLMAEF